MKRFVLPYLADDFGLYDTGSHRTKYAGYLNPKIAASFADAVASRISKRFDKTTRKLVILYADGSTTILGWLVYVKLMQMGYKEIEFRKSTICLSHVMEGTTMRVECDGKREDEYATQDIMDGLEDRSIRTGGRDVFILVDDTVALGRCGRSICLAEKRIIDLCYVMHVCNEKSGPWKLPFKEMVWVQHDGVDGVFICDEYKSCLPKPKTNMQSLPADFNEHMTPGFEGEPLPAGVTILSTILNTKVSRLLTGPKSIMEQAHVAATKQATKNDGRTNARPVRKRALRP